MRPAVPAAAVALLLAATPALAHHPLAGAPMETFSHGLLSGVGHPLLGFDHLAFVLVAGIAAGLAGRPVRAPLAYVGAMPAGCLLSASALPLPATETMIAVSLALVGGLVALARIPLSGRATALIALFGLFHGSAFGETVAAQEAGAGAAVLLGYLLGLGALQAAIAISAAWVTARAVSAGGASSAMGPRLAGAMAAGIGVFLSLEVLETAVFAGMG